MAVNIADMTSRLYTVDKLREKLSVNEPLTARMFPVGKNVKFRLAPGWNVGDMSDPRQPVDAYVKILDQEVQLTQEALLQATSAVSLSKGFVMKSPAKLVEPALDYYFREGFKEGKEFQVLSVDGTSRKHQVPLGVGFTAGTIVPFSSLQLLDTAVEKVCSHYGVQEADLWVDYKMEATLPHTAFSLVIPEVVRQMSGTGVDDDLWSAGVRISNSPVGKGPTSVEGYLFRYVCTNGQICVGANAGAWNRRSGQGVEVYDWAAAAVDAVIGGFESELDATQSLTEERIEGEAADVLADLYDHFSLPAPVRDSITERMVEVTDLNMYHLQAAITEEANTDGMAPATAESLMRVGGFVSHAVSSRCGSCHQILRRGHTAHSEATAEVLESSPLLGGEETDEAGDRLR